MSETTDAKTTEAARNKAYTKAQSALRAAHEDEFYDLLAKEYGDAGLEPPRRRLTEEQRAEAQVRDLLAKHPALASKFTQTAQG